MRSEDGAPASEGDHKYQEIFASAGVALWAQDFSEVRRYVEEVAPGGAEELAELFEREPEHLVQAASRIRVEDVNDETLRLFEVESREQLLGALTNVVLIPESYAALRDQLLAHARGVKRFSSETVVQNLRGERRHILLTSIIRPNDDTWDRGLISTIDITETKRLEARLRHSQKMEAIGQLAGGMAHDFNNLLAVILGRAELLGKHLDGENLSHLSVIQESVQQASQLTSRLLAFSRRQVLQPKVADLNTIVAETVDMLRHLLGEQITIDVRLSDALSPVRVDAVQIGQLVLNIALNARDAMPDGGTLLIESFDEVGVDGASSVVLRMRDDGHGIDESTQARIFEPFFTTKQDGKGTGLGLATVYGIVEQSGGTIRVDSAPGQGATFEMRLPPADCARTVRASSRLPSTVGVETILLVENDPAVGAVTAELLRDHGFEVLLAESGEDALEMMGSGDAPLDLLLSDVVMPKMKGPELAERMCAARPGTRVLFMSGSTTDVRARPLLRKPFSTQTLVTAVRGALDA